MTDLDFMARGACRGTEPVRWTNEDGSPGYLHIFYSDDPTAIEKAKAICLGCGVREECKRHALDAPEDHGVWGGLDPKERLRIRHKLGKK
jgi:WhiB family redox-sensing transcriptional regulator